MHWPAAVARAMGHWRKPVPEREWPVEWKVKNCLSNLLTIKRISAYFCGDSKASVITGSYVTEWVHMLYSSRVMKRDVAASCLGTLVVRAKQLTIENALLQSPSNVGNVHMTGRNTRSETIPKKPLHTQSESES